MALLTKALKVKFLTAGFVLTVSNVHTFGTVKGEKKTPKMF